MRSGRAAGGRSTLGGVPEQSSGAKRVVAHLDCDAFYASVELLRRPELRGKAVIVAGSGPRAVVTTASYEARRFGVGSAMPASRARRLCPHAIVLPPDFAAYRATSQAVWAIVRERIGALQHLGLDEAYADLTGVEKPLRVLREVVAAVEEATGIALSVGIGPSRLVAKLCSDADKPRGFLAMGREQAASHFAAHPASRLPGIGPKTAERLRGMGIETVGALQRAAEADLAARFGARHGRELLARAHFHDDSPVVTEQVLKSRSNERTFDEDVASHAELEEILRRLARELCEGLQARGKRGRTIGIKVRLDDWTNVTRARTIEAPTHEVELVTRIALELLRAYAPPRPVRLLGVRLASFEDEGAAAAPGPPADQLALPL
jgi:DNA polymerase-4